MRKLVLQMMTSLNGRLDEPDAWASGISNDLYADIDRLYGTFDTILVGRTTYEEMIGYWPGAETAADGSEESKSMARKMNTYKKFVFSSNQGEQALQWHNAEQVLARSDTDITDFINGLKGRPGRDIHLAGGAGFAQTVIRLGLVDEYQFFLHPVLSAGATWFDQIEEKRVMKLLNVAAYDNGVVGLHYQPVAGP